MGLDLEKLSDNIDKALAKETTESIKEFLSQFPKVPRGWISINDHLPQCTAIDYLDKGYSEYLVKTKDGKKFKTWVGDPMIWKYYAIEAGITHWLNGKSLPKTNKRNQAILDQALTYGIDLTDLRVEYGLPFAIKLFTYVLKKTEEIIDDKKVLIPKNYDGKYPYTSLYNKLALNGFPVKTWPVDYVDEDTGEVVTIQTHLLLPLPKTK